MINYILLTHGRYGEEIIRTSEMFLGKIDNCINLPLFEGDSPEVYRKKIEKILLDNNNTMLLTDLNFGTPQNCALYIIKKYNLNTRIISGINLTLALELFSNKENSKIEDIVNRVHEIKDEIIKII